MKKYIKKFICLCLVLALVMSVQSTAVFAQSSSSEKVDLKISSAREFKEFLHNVKSGNDYAGKRIVLTKDLELEAYGANILEFPNDGEFSGTFDGKGHKIYGFELGKNYWDNSVFGTITSEGMVCNLIIEEVIGTTCGVLCDNNYGTIENCSIANCEVNTSHSNYNCNSSGGLASYNKGTIRNCTVSIIMTYGCDEIGGIVYQNDGIIENCSSNVKYDNDKEWGAIGGIAYYNDGDIINCYSISSNVAGAKWSYGIVCSNTGYVKNSYCAEEKSEYNFAYEKGMSKNVSSYSLKYMKSAAFVKLLNKNLGSDDLKWELKGSDYPTLVKVNEITFNTLPSKKGTVKASYSYAPKGKTVKLTVSMKKGYELKDISVKTKTGKKVELTKVKNNVYKFTMPNEKVVVSVKTKVTN